MKELKDSEVSEDSHSSSFSSSPGERVHSLSEASSTAPSFASTRPSHSVSSFFRTGEVSSVFSEFDTFGGSSGNSLTLNARAVILGDSSSGRTSLAASVRKVVSRLRTALDYQSASSGSSITYGYNSSISKKKEYLNINIIDGGPVPLRCGAVHRFLPYCDTVIITFDLTFIKQRRVGVRKLFSFAGNSRGNKDDPLIHVHEKDRLLLHDLLATVISRISPNDRFPTIIFVGTHKDLLTDQSSGSIELLLKELRSICSEFLSSFKKVFVLNSLFAVSLIDGSCISENRGGPSTVAEMWNFICDITMKDAVSRQSLMSSQSDFAVYVQHGHLTYFPQIFCESNCNGKDINDSNPGTDDEEQEGVIGERRISQDGRCSSSCNVSIAVASIDLLFDCATSKLLRLIFRAKAERKSVFIYLNTLCKLMYPFGLISKDQVISVLLRLHCAGELVLPSPRHEDLLLHDICVCLYPQLIERAQSTIFLYWSYVNYHREDHSKLLRDVDMEECERCDPCHGISCGVFSQALLFPLAHRLKLASSPMEWVRSFAMLLLLSGMAFTRRCCESPVVGAETPCATLSSCAGVVRVLAVMRAVSSAGPVSRPESPHASLCTQLVEGHQAMEYVVPSLIRANCPGEVIHSVRHVAAKLTGVSFKSECNVILRAVSFYFCPSSFFSLLTVYLHNYLRPMAPIFKDAIWLHPLSINGEVESDMRILIYLGGAGGEGGVSFYSLDNGETVSLEFYAFSNMGYLPLVLFLDEITRQVMVMIKQEYPGLPSWPKSSFYLRTSQISCDRVNTSLIIDCNEFVNTKYLDEFFCSIKL